MLTKIFAVQWLKTDSNDRIGVFTDTYGNKKKSFGAKSGLYGG